MNPLQGPRANASLLLIAGAVVLLAAIAIGNRMGDRVLGQVTERGNPAVPGVKVTPARTALDAKSGERNWKRLQVMSVATDPHFPDPRVTPEPPPTPRPRPPEPPPPPPTRRPTPVPNPTFTVEPRRVRTPEPTPYDAVTYPPLPGGNAGPSPIP